MATTYPQRRQIRPSRIHALPQGAEDGPWTVGVEENPHDTSSFTIYVRTHTRNLTLGRSAREIIELHRQLCDGYPAVPCPAFPIRSALVRPESQRPSTQPKFPERTTPTGRPEGIRSNARRSVAINHDVDIQVPVEKFSANTTNMALAWYLTALSNDHVFRQVPPWKNFVRVRTEDFESASVNAITAAMEKSTSSEGAIVRGPRKISSAEDGSFVNIPYERRTSQNFSNSATCIKESVPYKVQVSDFEMVCVLGIGSRGKVLLVHHKSSSDLYALKVIAKRRVLASQEVQRTLTEQAVLSRMVIDGTNPFVAKLWRSFHDEDNLYLAMDFYPGGDLRTQLDRWGSFGYERSRFYAAEVVEGIEGLHAAGVIHRNLKPEHILIDKGGHIALCGFGKSKDFPRGVFPSRNSSGGGTPYWMNGNEELAESLQSNYLETTSSLCGTAAYFAPEVIMGLPYSYKIDWWSLGTILYEMLTGTRPFDADNMSDMYDRILQDELRFPEDESVDRHTKDLIQGLLQRDPALRLSGLQLKRHSYFLMIDWSDVHYKGCKPPYIPPTDSSNQRDTQNFEEAFLNMKPVVDDEIYVDMEQERVRGQTDSEPTGGEDPIPTPSQPGVSPSHPPDDIVDVFEGYSFSDGHSIAIMEGVPGKGKEGREDRETEAETIPRRNNLTEQTVLIFEALQSLTPPIQQRPPEPPPVYADTNLVLFPGDTLLAVPDIPTQVSAPPPILPTDVVANDLARRQHQNFKPKSHHPQRNFKHTVTVVSVSELEDRFLDNHANENVDATQEEQVDNRPWNFVDVDRGNHSGPHSIKSMSKHSVSTAQSSASLRTAGSKSTSILR